MVNALAADDVMTAPAVVFSNAVMMPKEHTLVRMSVAAPLLMKHLSLVP